MWSKRKRRNRRSARPRNVLDVKLRSSKVRAGRIRLLAITLGVAFGTIFGGYIVLRAGDWALDRFVYENRSFAIQEFDIQSDGVISPAQLRRWSGVKPGENLMALDLARVKRELELVPRIQSASVERILPDTLRITVNEREPIAQVNVPHLRPDGGIELVVFQLDADGYVVVPLDPRQRAVPLNQLDDPLPVLSGVNLADLQPGRRLDSPSVLAALRLIAAFGNSPMAGLVDLRGVDVSAPDILVATTGQGSLVTFGMDNLDQQLRRWRTIHDECANWNKVIATLDLAVTDSIPVRFVDASSLPPFTPTKDKPQHNRKRHV